MTPNAGEDVEQQELPFIAAGNATGTAAWEDSVFTKLHMFFSDDPTIMLLCIDPKEFKT